MHEAKMHKHNCFLTLTYNDKHLPPHGNLQYRDVQLFFKRLRKKALGRKAPIVASGDKPQIRFYMCGEYGEKFDRPHYHICLFGIDFTDKKYHSTTGSGSKLYRSPTLELLWPLGFSSIGDLNFESAAYVARYVMKKITGHNAKKHYQKTDPNTGEIINLTPEFNQMSRAQGIGKTWLDKYTKDVYNNNNTHVIVRGKKTNPPKYYDKQYKKHNPTQWENIEYDRYLNGKKHYEDQQDHRLKAKNEVTLAKLKLLKRKI